MDQAAVIEKIKKCLALSRGGVGETCTASYMAQKLISRYGIDEALLLSDKVELPADEKIVEKVVFKFDGPRTATWILNLGSALANVNNCKLWFHTFGNWKGANGSLTAAGRESDLSVISYMLSYLTPEIEEISKKEAKLFRESHGYSGGKNWSNSFKVGCVSKIAERLREGRDKAISDARASATDSVISVEPSNETPTKYALAVINNAIEVWGSRKKRADAWVKEHYKLYTSTSRSTSLHGTAYNAGRIAGGNIALSAGPRLPG
jgi:Protein of unknown function (DUF2786)